MLTLARARTSSGTDIYPAQRMDIAETTAETIRLIWPRLRSRKMDCAFEAPDHPMLVRANDGLIREALTNILDNAINYASANSLITVRLTQQDDEVVLEVEDEGPGMSPDEIAHAGIRFRRGAAGRSREGSGLGLAIAFTAAKVSSGTLSLRRRSDRSGLVVTLTLPADTDSQLKA